MKNFVELPDYLKPIFTEEYDKHFLRDYFIHYCGMNTKERIIGYYWLNIYQTEYKIDQLSKELWEEILQHNLNPKIWKYYIPYLDLYGYRHNGETLSQISVKDFFDGNKLQEKFKILLKEKGVIYKPMSYPYGYIPSFNSFNFLGFEHIEKRMLTHKERFLVYLKVKIMRLEQYYNEIKHKEMINMKLKEIFIPQSWIDDLERVLSE